MKGKSRRRRAAPSWTTPIGRIVGVQGIRGAVKVLPESPLTVPLLRPGETVHLLSEDGDEIEVLIESCRRKRTLYVVQLAGLEDRRSAEGLIGWQITARPGWKPELKENEYLLSDLLGLQVVTTDGESVGTVDDVLSTAAQDLLVTQRGFIPMVGEIVREVDLRGGRIIIAPIKGLLDPPGR